MGMSIYLYEVLDPDVESDVEEFEIYEDEFEEFPEEIKAKAYLKDYKFIDLEKICKDYEIDFDKVVLERHLEKELEIRTKDGKVVKIPWEVVDIKYTSVEKLPTIKVRELAYERYGYFGCYFKVHPFFEREKAKKHGLKRFYFDPEEMEPVLQIFHDGSRWKKIIEEFKKAKAEGKLCFVYVGN